MVQMTEIPSLPHPAPSSSSPKPCPLPSPNPTKSFWHSEPDEVLIGHRTTEELPEYVKIMVVGSGITGTSAVRWLSEEAGTGKEGYEGRVLMLEAREACWGATGRVSLILCSEFLRGVFATIGMKVQDVIVGSDISLERRSYPTASL
jgi:hypothetical protein